MSHWQFSCLRDYPLALQYIDFRLPDNDDNSLKSAATS